jgi:hypothetical protein
MAGSSKKGSQPRQSKMLYFFLTFAALAFIHIFYQHSQHGKLCNIISPEYKYCYSAEQDQKFHEAMEKAHKVLLDLQAHLPNEVSAVSGTSGTISTNNQPGQPVDTITSISKPHKPVKKEQYIPAVVSAPVEDPSGAYDIVIGMAQDTDPKNLVTFCASLRK